MQNEKQKILQNFFTNLAQDINHCIETKNLNDSHEFKSITAAIDSMLLKHKNDWLFAPLRGMVGMVGLVRLTLTLQQDQNEEMKWRLTNTLTHYPFSQRS